MYGGDGLGPDEGIIRGTCGVLVGRYGPAASGEGCLKEVEEGDPEETVPDLKGCTADWIDGLLIAKGEGKGRSKLLMSDSVRWR